MWVYGSGDSVTDLSEISPEDALHENSLKQYHQKMDVLKANLEYLHTNLAALKEISQFPHDLFFGDRPNAFLYLCWKNMLEYSIVIIRRIWKDPDGIDLNRLHDFVEMNTKEKYKEIIRRRLGALRQDKRQVKRILKKIAKIRNVLLAHLSPEYHIEPVRRINGVGLSDLTRVADYFGKLFNILSFSTTYEFVWMELGAGRRSGDLTFILNSIALQTNIVKDYDDPHLRPIWITDYRPHLNAEDLKAINKIRRWGGLEEIQ